MTDFDDDGDLDWMGVSMTLGQAFIVEQVEPDTGLVLTVSLPDGFSDPITKLNVMLAYSVPLTGFPAALLANIPNVDADGDGEMDVDQILTTDHDLTLAIDLLDTEPAPVTAGSYHVVVGVYVEGGGEFQPVDGVDYIAYSDELALGYGKQEVTLEVELYSEPPMP
jgi:hypothetical protein